MAYDEIPRTEMAASAKIDECTTYRETADFLFFCSPYAHRYTKCSGLTREQTMHVIRQNHLSFDAAKNRTGKTLPHEEPHYCILVYHLPLARQCVGGVPSHAVNPEPGLAPPPSILPSPPHPPFPPILPIRPLRHLHTPPAPLRPAPFPPLAFLPQRPSPPFTTYKQTTDSDSPSYLTPPPQTSP